MRYYKESTTAYMAAPGEAPHLVAPYWLHFRGYMAGGESSAARAAQAVNPELKVLAYGPVRAELAVNPELKAMVYAAGHTDDLHMNPELKVLANLPTR